MAAMGTSFLVAVVVLLLAVAPATAQSPQPEEIFRCNTPMDLLRTCKYVMMAGSKPTSDCCGSLSFLKDYWPRCLCRYLQLSGNETSPVYTPYYLEVMASTVVCGIPHGFSDCPGMILPPRPPLLFLLPFPGGEILGLSPDSDEASMFRMNLNLPDAPAGSPVSPQFNGGVGSASYRLGTVASFIAAAAWLLI
ncbi:hypothetical protein EJ110_NYTH47911 [Nymphaea thermarum]|nr:hypothetical protein EJ110_NYTH47911 [Nymphaea thermarum]